MNHFQWASSTMLYNNSKYLDLVHIFSVPVDNLNNDRVKEQNWALHQKQFQRVCMTLRQKLLA